MIIPLPLVGLALASAVSMQKKDARNFQPKKYSATKKFTKPVYKKSNKPFPFALPDSLRNLFKGLSSTLSSAVQKKPSENYEEMIKGYLPPNATLLTPQYPQKTAKYIMTDLDGDSQKELAAAYRLNDTNTVMILKKQDAGWTKIAETPSSNYESVNFLGSANILGDNRQQLLLGWKTADAYGKLFGYSLDEGKLNEVFSHNYNYFEVLNSINGRAPAKQAQLAFWSHRDNDRYDIEIKKWNGSALDVDNNQVQYFYTRVLPYYAMKVKKMPYNSSNWYSLADVLEKMKLYQDSLSAVDLGVRLSPSTPIKEEFLKLRERIVNKI